MGRFGNIGVIPLEETAELITKAFQTMDFKEADMAMARNGMKQLVALQGVKNGVYDVVCWSNESGAVVHAVTRSPRPGHDLQSSVLIHGEAVSHQNVDIGKNVHELEFPNGRPMVSIAEMSAEAEELVAREHGIALSPAAEMVRVGALEEKRIDACEGLDEIIDEIGTDGRQEAGLDAGAVDIDETR